MKVSLLHRPGTCSLKDMLRAWSTCVGKATALPEEKTFSGWEKTFSGLVWSLVVPCWGSPAYLPAVQQHCPSSSLDVWPKPSPSRIFSPRQSPGDVSCWGAVCALQSFCALLGLFWADVLTAQHGESWVSLPRVGRTDSCLIYTTPLTFLPLFAVLPVLSLMSLSLAFGSSCWMPPCL